MTSRAMLAAWLAAIVAFTVAAAGLYRMGGSAWPVRRMMERTEIAAIGTSLTIHAIPYGPIPGGLLGDGRQHRRFAYDDMPEHDAVSVLNEVLKAGARTVLLEVNPFAFDLQYRVVMNAREARRWTAQTTMLATSERLHSGIGTLLGRTAFQTQEPDDLKQTVNTADAATEGVFYPLHLRPPHELKALQEAVARARAQGAEIVLVAPPRAATAQSWIGLEGAHTLASHLTALAQELSLPLFSPGPGWPDDLFIDNAHVNASGRQRFCAELAAWYGGSR